MSWYKEYDKREKERMKQRGEEQPKVQKRLKKLAELRKLERLTPEEISKLRKAAKTDEAFKKALAQELVKKREEINKVRNTLGMKPLMTADQRRKEFEEMLQKDQRLKDERERLLKEKLGVVAKKPKRKEKKEKSRYEKLRELLVGKRIPEVEAAQELVTSLRIFDIMNGTEVAYRASDNKITNQTVLLAITTDIKAGSIIICETCGGVRGFRTMYAAMLVKVDKDKDEYIYVDSKGTEKAAESFNKLTNDNKFKLYNPDGLLYLADGTNIKAVDADETKIKDYVAPTEYDESKDDDYQADSASDDDDDSDDDGFGSEDEMPNDDSVKDKEAKEAALTKGAAFITQDAFLGVFDYLEARYDEENGGYYVQWNSNAAIVKPLYERVSTASDFEEGDIFFYRQQYIPGVQGSFYIGVVISVGTQANTVAVLNESGKYPTFNIGGGGPYYKLTTLDYGIKVKGKMYKILDIKLSDGVLEKTFKGQITKGSSTVIKITKEEYDSFSGSDDGRDARDKDTKISDDDIENIKEVLNDNLNTASIVKSNAYKRELQRLQDKYPDKKIKVISGGGSTTVNEATLKGLAGLNFMNTDMFFALEKPMCASLDLADQKMYLLGDVSLSCRRHEPAEPDMMSSSDEEVEDAAGIIDDMKKNYKKMKGKAKEAYKKAKKAIKEMTKEKLHEPLTSMEVMLEGYDSENELLTKPVERICPTLGLADRKMQELSI